MVRIPLRSIQYYNCVFTLNNPTEEEFEKFRGFLVTLPSAIQYISFQTERGANGTIHLQGYCEFYRKQRYSAVKRILSDRVVFFRREKTQQQAIDYTQKEETRIDGPRGENGMKKYTRKDSMKNLMEDLRDGASRDELDENYPVQEVLYGERVNRVFIERRGKRKLKPSKNNVSIYVGPSGTGKTTTAWTLYPNAYSGEWPTGGRWWWPNYRGQETIIYDEFRENLSYQEMLRLLDIHPMGIEFKCGNSQNVSKKVIITTIRDPKTWYRSIPDKYELERRINDHCTIYDFTPGKTYPNFEKEARMGRFEFEPYDPAYDDHRGHNNEGHYNQI